MIQSTVPVAYGLTHSTGRGKVESYSTSHHIVLYGIVLYAQVVKDEEEIGVADDDMIIPFVAVCCASF